MEFWFDTSLPRRKFFHLFGTSILPLRIRCALLDVVCNMKKRQDFNFFDKPTLWTCALENRHAAACLEMIRTKEQKVDSINVTLHAKLAPSDLDACLPHLTLIPTFEHVTKDEDLLGNLWQRAANAKNFVLCDFIHRRWSNYDLRLERLCFAVEQNILRFLTSLQCDFSERFRTLWSQPNALVPFFLFFSEESKAQFFNDLRVRGLSWTRLHEKSYLKLDNLDARTLT